MQWVRVIPAPWLLVGLVSCATAAPSASPPVAEVPPTVAPAEETAEAAEPAVEPVDPWRVEGLPAPLKAAGPVVCDLPPAVVEELVHARLRPGGAEAFGARGLEMTLSLAKGDGFGSGYVAGSREGLALRGILNQGEIRLFAARPFVLGGWVVPRHNTRLTVARIADEGIGVGIDGEHLEDVAAAEEPRTRVACPSLRLDQGDDFGPWAGLPPSLPARTGWGELAGSDPVPLSVEPEGAPVATLAAGAGVAVFDSRGKHLRVAVPRSMVLVFGWVPSARVQAKSEPVEDLGSGFGFGTGGGGGSARPLVCPHPLSIVVEVEGEQAIALRADPGVELLRSGGADETRAAIRFYRRYWFHLAPEASLWVRPADLEGCGRKEP